ncbi:MAG: agmatinase [Nitrospirota bacterium]|nr:agmatinase [Nitrospirota bacterium]
MPDPALFQIDPTRRFMASRENYDEGKIIIFSAPLDHTTSYRPGTRFAGPHVREASYGLEEFDFLGGKTIEDVSFFDWGELLLPPGNTPAALQSIYHAAAKVFADGKIPFTIGGEHLISSPLIIAASEKYPDLAVFHFDAHADLREDYMGMRESHASVMRRVAEVIGPENIYQFGIRSGSKDEREFAKKTNLMSWPGDSLAKAIEETKGRPVYLTIDIDVVDPAFAPGTGTPEPGGCTSADILGAVNRFAAANLIGFDLVEVSPPNDSSNITSILAAKIIRQALLAV